MHFQPQYLWLIHLICPNGGQVLDLATEGKSSLHKGSGRNQNVGGKKKHSSSFLPLPCGVTNNLMFVELLPQPPAGAAPAAEGPCVAFCGLAGRSGSASPPGCWCRTRQRSHPGPAGSPAECV